MKKIIFALCIATACVASVSAKKKAAKEAAPAAAPVVLTTAADSVSFAAGYAQTEGLLPYLQNQYNVDTTYMADFIQGFKDAKQNANDPHFVAYQAGGSIAKMVLDRMIPGIGKEFKSEGDSLSADLFYAGFIASLMKDSTVFTQAKASERFQAKIKAIQDAREQKRKAEAEANKQKGEQWLAENAKKEGVVTLPSGLQYKVLTAGKGVTPKAEDEVTVKYAGRLIDGTEFDSSYKRPGETSKFKCNQVIKGWTEALTMMPEGSKWELYIPQDLAYGDRAQGAIPACSALIFTVELVQVTPAPGSESNAAAAKNTPAKKSSTKKGGKK
ncbi:MAG: FKBP-type peptidyl-prolyl cis-trans isomerase [Prevotella sp.]|nr:FKBP-type peptidyl-prolyl cis-trans isomerase [Prevotella sp.]